MTSAWNRRHFLKGAMTAPMLGVAADIAVAEDQPKVVGRRAEVKDAVRTQVLVVGAGASGVPAALAAARAGAKVILLEEDSIPGGAPVSSYYFKNLAVISHTAKQAGIPAQACRSPWPI